MSIEANNSVEGVILRDLRIPKLGDRVRQMADVLDEAAGDGCWAYRWLKGDEAVDFDGVCEDYEISYSQFLTAHPYMLDRLAQFEDVYDTTPDNVESGLDYRAQSGAVHIQDIALRKVMQAFDRSFTPDGGLLQVRSNSAEELGRALSPFRVPYHSPDLILLPSTEEGYPWQLDSIEAFYQLNRRLLLSQISDCETVKNVYRVVSEFAVA